MHVIQTIAVWSSLQFMNACAMRTEIEEAMRVDSSLDANATVESPVKKWPTELDGKYEHIQKLTCGFQGCAYLVKRKSDNKKMVAKLCTASDEAKMLDNPFECEEMRYLRYAACNSSTANSEILRLQEMYIPGCDEKGVTSGGVQYLVMPFAGPKQINKLMTEPVKDVATQKTLFAQLVASLYSMHSVGIWHNDLNGGNVMIDGDRLALIDFGLMKMETCKSKTFCLGGQNRDANGLFRWGAVLAGCKSNARYNYKAWWLRADTTAQKKNQRRCMDCFKSKWNIDKAFEEALQKVFDGNVKESAEQHIKQLYDTDFVKKNLPATDARYRVPGTEECRTWSSSKLAEEVKKGNAMRPPAK